MSSKLQVVHHGPLAVKLLADILKAVKGGDPLATVRVVCPSRYAQLSLRRHLASQIASPAESSNIQPPCAPRGIANVIFQSMGELTQSLAQLKRIDATGPPIRTVRAAALRSALRQGHDSFASVLGHHEGQNQLLVAIDTINSKGPEALQALRKVGRRSAELATLVSTTNRKLKDAGYCSNAKDLTQSAVDAVNLVGLGSSKIGIVILYLPTSLNPWDWALLRSLADHSQLYAVAGLTEDSQANIAAQETLTGLENLLGKAKGGQSVSGLANLEQSELNSGLTSGALIVAPDPDTEVREVLHQVALRIQSGVHMADMAICFPSHGDYARLLHQHMVEAQIPFVGQSLRPAGNHWAGRVILKLMALVGSDLPRAEVCELISAGPIRQIDGSVAPGAKWVQLSKRAGIVKGAQQWVSRLNRLSQNAAVTRGQVQTNSSSHIADAINLRLFVEALERDLAVAAKLERWDALAAWSTAAIQRLLGSPVQRTQWPDAEREAAESVETMLNRLSTLDDLDPKPNLTMFQDALASELMSKFGHEGSVGAGVLVAPMGSIAAMPLHTVFVIGLTEGALPRHKAAGSIIKDIERKAVGIPTSAQDINNQRLQYIATLSNSIHSVRSYPRLDFSSRTYSRPSAWFDLGVSKESPRIQIESFDQWIRGKSKGPSAQARNVASIVAWQKRGYPLADHSISKTTRLGLSIELLEARRKGTLSPWDGNLAGIEFPSVTNGTIPVSPTRLESYAACPKRYLFTYIMQIEALRTPEQLRTISAADKGTLIHEILQRFIDLHVSENKTESDNQTIACTKTACTNTVDWTQLKRIAEELFSEYGSSGATGAQVLWNTEQKSILRDLERFYTQYEQDLANGFRPVIAEMQFGSQFDNAVVIDLPNDRTLKFRGYIDRVDSSSNGTLRVLDYKTGDNNDYSNIHEDPAGAGASLQLVIYAQAAKQHLKSSNVWAGYWFVSKRGQYKLLGYDVGDAQVDRVTEVLDVLASGIDAGRFPSRPGNKTFKGYHNCLRCNFEQCCPDRDRSWERQKTDPALSKYVALVEGESA